MTNPDRSADVCFLLEGTYPFVAGGVSSWVHELIKANPDLSYHLVTLLPHRNSPQTRRYEVPANVVGLTPVYLQDLPAGRRHHPEIPALMRRLEPLLAKLVGGGGGLEEIAEMIRLLRPHADSLGRHALLNSPASWATIVRMYENAMPESSFLDFFWTWRSLFGGLFAVLLAPLPKAGIYHAASTGYAGLLAARARLETGRPMLVTEHGIYTNERRIELALADWLFDGIDTGLRLDQPVRDLRRMWVETFVGYSRACYGAADRVITLYGGNQAMQLRDGADPARMRVIPNGIDVARFASISRPPEPRPPTIALIGRVVPIKDVKTFIRACARLIEAVPDLKALIMGPTDEDAAYAEECRAMIATLDLGRNVEFTGRVRIDDYLGRIDVVVLTSISEAQPLVILEAGAAGIPCVATDVGACREMIMGRDDEDPPLGAGGAVTALSDPAAIAGSIADLLTKAEYRERCSQAIRRRVQRYYNKIELDAVYGELYRDTIAKADAAAMRGAA